LSIRFIQGVEVTASEQSHVGDTRGRLLSLLCAAKRTTSDLAKELGISANGVRWHLDRLEQEGLVDKRVVRAGVGKPAHEYRLTPEGSRRLSRAYLPLLQALLSVVLERAGHGEGERLLRETGRNLARRHPKAEGSVRERVDAAVGLLGEFGGVATVNEEENGLCIQGACCPLRALVPDHPLACKAVEAMMEEYIGMGVREACEKGDPPGCRMFITGTDR
jgi:predicted ArsR family transcriptional regulator